MLSFKLFLDELEKKHGHRKATLIAHADPFDQEGPNLHAVVEHLGIADNVVFSKDRVDFNQMAALYNVCDVCVNKSAAEGFGLPILEGKMSGKPVIAIKTGGLTRQVEDHMTGEQYGVALEPEVKRLNGTQQIPFIWDDFVSNETFAAAIMKMYELGPEARKELGLRAMKHAHRDYDMKKLVGDWDETLTKLVSDWREKKHPNCKRWVEVTL
jgi:glycosyltransferase involved in cell wall biosynthesis